VNFQKGERQMNMDYSLNEALKYTTNGDTPGVILAYDINCQYSIHLRRRLAEGPFLDIREDLPILPAIGLFHVHGHQEKCYARYAPTFVRGIGKGDGEILETNWSVLNGISSMTRTMTLAHRSEVMDAHIGDNNWKKMINMGALRGFPC
jgi:Kyakuja-Dileera-Zisupton transposase